MFQLTPHQSSALQIIAQNQFTLLHGVTGSGKTEVYIRAVKEAVGQGQQAIVLVPEISLTPQAIERFSEHFTTAVIHSHLTKKQKTKEWNRILNNEVQVIVGARSALFTPVNNLGLIIIDEEHDSSYKQDSHPHYHAREVAVKRAELSGAKVILGSATPSLESYYHLESGGIWKLAELPTRIDDRPLPPVTIVDMRAELKEGNRTVFSRALRAALKATIAEGKQAILFQNRRGYSTFLLCRECGWVVECPHCAVSMTWHKDGSARCHYCGLQSKVPPQCPQCQSKAFRYFGTGTQKVESELAVLLPQARVIRMDKDTTSKKGAHAQLLSDFADGKGDILLGTQMIAKGHDFPNVNLVGVISADTALNFPDFRASEKTFQILTQVAGRAGRSMATAESKVVVQTYHPEHLAILAAATHDYASFYKQELEFRQELGYPPFSKLILITVSSKHQQSAAGLIPRLIPSPINRLRGEYRFQRLLKAGEMSGEELMKLSQLEIPGVKVEIDVDPMDML